MQPSLKNSEQETKYLLMYRLDFWGGSALRQTPSDIKSFCFSTVDTDLLGIYVHIIM